MPYSHSSKKLNKNCDWAIKPKYIATYYYQFLLLYNTKSAFVNKIYPIIIFGRITFDNTFWWTITEAIYTNQKRQYRNGPQHCKGVLMHDCESVCRKFSSIKICPAGNWRRRLASVFVPCRTTNRATRSCPQPVELFSCGCPLLEAVPPLPELFDAAGSKPWLCAAKHAIFQPDLKRSAFCANSTSWLGK